MTRAIDTKVKGEPASVQSSVEWLRDSFGAGVTDAGADIGAAISSTVLDWEGTAGESFRSALTLQRTIAGQVSDGARIVTDSFDRYGDALRAAKRQMAEIRERASGAGLELTADEILPPTPVPNEIPTLAKGASDSLRAAHQAAVDALAEFQRKAKVFREAAEDAAKARKDLISAGKDLIAAGAQLEELLKHVKPEDWSKVGPLLGALRKSMKALPVLKWADITITVGEMAHAYLNGEPPGEIGARTVGEELGFLAELASNNPRVRDYLYSLGLDDEDLSNLEERGGEYAEDLYLKLPPEVRAGIDSAIEWRLNPLGTLADDVPDAIDYGVDGLQNLGEGLQDQAGDLKDEAEDFGEDVQDKAEDIEDGVGAVKEFVDDFDFTPERPW